MDDETNYKDPNPNYPIQREDLLRGRFDIEAIGEVPAHLRSIDLPQSLPPMSHAAIDLAELRETSSEPLAPFRPAWVASIGRPARARFSGRPRLKLRHHGVDLDPLRVWGADDRRIYDDKRYPWGCVCRIVIAGGAWGSGVIVGPRHVLTASHVVDWSKEGAGLVEVHRADLYTSAVSAIKNVVYYTRIIGTEVDYSEVDQDYAVLVTADRLGDRYGSFGVRTYDSGMDGEHVWYNIGYPLDRIERGMYPIYQRRQKLDEDEVDYGSARSMTTSADIAKGQSGGPMFGLWEDGPYVVAVVSAEGIYVASGYENWCSGGNDLTRLVNYARSIFP